MNVAFCCDKAALPGLHVSLFSLLTSNRRHSREPLHIFILYEGFSSADCAGLHETAKIDRTATIVLRPFSTAHLREFKDLHGNYMTYARLFLADALPEIDSVLYLDSDIIVNCSIAPLQATALSPYLVGAVSAGSTIEWSLENELFVELGLSRADPYFNAGILLLDLKRWRAEGMTERCTAFLRTHKARCQSADQTVLNAFFSKQHMSLPLHYNLPFYPPGRPPADGLPEGIIHFVAAPKPWDFCGRFIHGSGALFHSYLAQTAYHQFSRPVFLPLRRTLLLSRSYFRTIKKRLSAGRAL